MKYGVVNGVTIHEKQEALIRNYHMAQDDLIIPD